jgi:uncharacterized protein with PIN domain
MVIDTSAVLAWLKQEPERERMVSALEAHSIWHASISLPSAASLAVGYHCRSSH